jgi:hypothetical protein
MSPLFDGVEYGDRQTFYVRADILRKPGPGKEPAIVHSGSTQRERVDNGEQNITKSLFRRINRG